MNEILESTKKVNDLKNVFYEEDCSVENYYLEGEDCYSLQGFAADFTHWGKMPYWSLEEGVSLLLGQDPQFVNWNIVRHHQTDPFTNVLSLNYAKLRKIVLRAFKTQEIAEQNSPVTFMEWADSRGIEVPNALRQHVAERKIINSTVDPEVENLLKAKDKRIQELETLAWEGSDENASTYSRELAIAVKAHNVISKNWKEGLSIKKQITIWLQENYPKLSNEEKERIAKICNWQKMGGAPSTPGKRSMC